MSTPFREPALQALINADDERPRIRLVPPRRWLTALAVVAVVAAGVLYAVIATMRSPVNGLALINGGGFSVITLPEDATVSAGERTPGDRVTKGQELATATTSTGKMLRLEAPIDGILMADTSLGGASTLTEGTTVFVIAADTSAEPTVEVLLPGLEATAITSGQVAVGSRAWVEPAGVEPIECSITRVSPYPIAGDVAASISPNPVMTQFAVDQGTVQAAEATCPSGSLDSLLPGEVVPIVVQVAAKSPVSMLFGKA